VLLRSKRLLARRRTLRRDYRALPSQTWLVRDLKGIAGPVRAWTALRASSAEGRFEAMHASGLTDLVGREEELELLLRRWAKAKTGEGQVVLLSGEAGIGKSRLTAALLERLATEAHTRLRLAIACGFLWKSAGIFVWVKQVYWSPNFDKNDTLQINLPSEIAIPLIMYAEVI
jgi:hypothetical protein